MPFAYSLKGDKVVFEFVKRIV